MEPVTPGRAKSATRARRRWDPLLVLQKKAHVVLATRRTGHQLNWERFFVARSIEVRGRLVDMGEVETGGVDAGRRLRPATYERQSGR